VETPEPLREPDYDPVEPEPLPRRGVPALWGVGEHATWVAGLALAISAFTGWYAGTGEGVEVSVLGWHTGVLGKLVFFIGIATVAIVVARELGGELPSSAPESLVILALGSLATVFVLIRVISIPDSVLPADGRGIGIWISLLAALGVIAGGLLRAVEEL
jgi:hypothetical protein